MFVCVKLYYFCHQMHMCDSQHDQMRLMTAPLGESTCLGSCQNMYWNLCSKVDFCVNAWVYEIYLKRKISSIRVFVVFNALLSCKIDDDLLKYDDAGIFTLLCAVLLSYLFMNITPPSKCNWNSVRLELIIIQTWCFP